MLSSCSHGSSTTKLLTAKGVYGFFPANSVGDDIEMYTDDRRTDSPDDHPYVAPAIGEAARATQSCAGGFCRAERVRPRGLCRSLCRDDGSRGG